MLDHCGSVACPFLCLWLFFDASFFYKGVFFWTAKSSARLEGQKQYNFFVLKNRFICHHWLFLYQFVGGVTEIRNPITSKVKYSLLSLQSFPRIGNIPLLLFGKFRKVELFLGSDTNCFVAHQQFFIQHSARIIIIMYELRGCSHFLIHFFFKFKKTQKMRMVFLKFKYFIVGAKKSAVFLGISSHNF